MQRDSATYVDEPEDADEYAAWRSSSFSMTSVQPEIDKILSGRCVFLLHRVNLGVVLLLLN
jgi:hypothetical protein